MSPSNPLDNWTPPAELVRPLPRPVRNTARGIGSLLLALVVFAAGIPATVLLGRLFQRQQADSRRLAAEGRETQGAVSRLWHTGSKSDQLHVAYRFTANRQEFSGDALVGRQHWNQLEIGAPIAVRYLPADPARNYPSADPPSAVPPWVAYLVLLLAAVYAEIRFFNLNRARRLLARGRPAPALVTRSESRGQARRGAAYTLCYEYQLPDGGTRQVTRHTNRQPQPAGSVFCVLCDPNNPRRHIVYPSRLVKLAAR